MSELAKGVVVLFVGVLNLLIGILVLTRNPKNAINQRFFVICMSFVSWCLTLFLYEYPLFFNRLLWVQLVYMSAILYMTSTLYFSFVFPSVTFQKSWLYAKIYSVSYLIFSVWLMFFTKMWVVDVVIHPQHGLQTILNNQGYVAWIVATWVIFLWITINFIIKGKTATGYQKQQIGYLWVGYLLFGIAVTITDGIIPLVKHDTSYFYLSAATNLFFSIPVGYIILRHRFLDIRFILARSISYTSILIFFGLIYSLGIILLGKIFVNDNLKTDNIAIYTVLSLFMAFSFQPIRSYLEKTTDKLFFKVRYDAKELLHGLSQILSTSSDLKLLTNQILTVFRTEMRLNHAHLAIISNQQIYLEGDSIIRPEITMDEIGQFKKVHKLLDYDLMTEDGLKTLMKKFEASLAYPLHTNKQFIGLLLLGYKKSGDIFFQNDLDVIEISGPEIAVSVQNAQRFEEINSFNVTLQSKIKTATSELQNANNRLQKLDSLKDEFISIASHDLRSPLAITKGFLWMAVKDIGKRSPKASEHLSRALESTERSISLVNDMLDVSRIEAGRIQLTPKKINLTTLIKSVVEEFQTQASQKSITIKSSDSEDLYVFADEDRVRQVLGNLINNALKYSPTKAIVEINLTKTKKHISTSVSDNGIGISEKDQKKLFTKFGHVENTDDKIPTITGTGLGLYICKNIIELSNGQISVTSEPKKGSTFTFTLPTS